MDPRRSPLTSIVAAGLLALTITAVAAPSPPGLKGKRIVDLPGRHFPAAEGGDPVACEPESCQSLFVQVRPERRSQPGRPAPVEFAIRWPSEYDDFDLTVYRPDGAMVAGTTGRVGSAEAVFDRRPMQGLYRMVVSARDVTDSDYEAVVQVERIPRRFRGPRRELLPNLQTLPPDNLHVAIPSGYPGGDPLPGLGTSCYPQESLEAGVSRCLRFDTAIANTGPGELRMRFLLSGVGTDQRMQQVVDMTKGSPRYRDAGEYEWHQSHGHAHYAGFAGYRLSSVYDHGSTGPVVAEETKAGFCLQDTELSWWRRRGNAPSTFTYPACTQPHERDSIGTWGVMGISRGWTDVYTWDLPDQYVPIDGLPDGRYLLETTADASRRVKETDEDDNLAWALIRLSGDEATVLDSGIGSAPATV
jgi:hypothetical protein